MEFLTKAELAVADAKKAKERYERAVDAVTKAELAVADAKKWLGYAQFVVDFTPDSIQRRAERGTLTTEYMKTSAGVFEWRDYFAKKLADAEAALAVANKEYDAALAAVGEVGATGR